MALTKIKNTSLDDADLVTLADNGVGTGANQIVQRDGSGDIPGVLRSSDAGTTFVAPTGDGSNLTGVLKPGDAHDVLVSGTNIKSINGDSILGSGDLGVGDKDVFSILKKIDVPIGLCPNHYNDNVDFKYWTTTNLIIVHNPSPNKIYVINKLDPEGEVKTYTYSGLVAFDIISDTLALATTFDTSGSSGSNPSVVFKIEISGTTFTKGADSNILATAMSSSSYSSTTWSNSSSTYDSNHQVNGMIVTSPDQAFIDVMASRTAFGITYYASGSCAVDINGTSLNDAPIIGTPSDPDEECSGFKTFKKVSPNQCIVSYRPGAGGYASMWLLSIDGNNATSGDRIKILKSLQLDADEDGNLQHSHPWPYGFCVESNMYQEGSLGEGYASNIFTFDIHASSSEASTHKRHSWLEIVGANTILNLVTATIESNSLAGSVTFARDRKNVNASSGGVSDYAVPYRIIKGVRDDEICLCYLDSAIGGKYAIRYWHWDQAGSNGLTSQLNSSSSTPASLDLPYSYAMAGGSPSHMSRILPSMFINDEAPGGITILWNNLRWMSWSGSGQRIEPYITRLSISEINTLGDNANRVYITNSRVLNEGGTGVVNNSYGLVPQSIVPSDQGDPDSSGWGLSNDTYTMTQANPIEVGGYQYMISNDYTMISSDNFLDNSNISFRRTHEVLPFFGKKTILPVGDGFALGLDRRKFYLLKITGIPE
jgi:hypothetical protein